MSKKFEKLLLELNSDFDSLIPFIKESINQLNNKSEFKGKSKKLFSEKDNMLITYADQFYESGKSNLKSLGNFLENDLKGVMSILHILPFYPWTSDDGFSPTDYKKVSEEYGSWDDIETIPVKKMFDCVFNHLSSESEDFKKALEGSKKHKEMFHLYPPREFETAQMQNNIPIIVRPRTSPLFTPYEIDGVIHYAWTTFSADQIDTNLNNKDMLQYILESFFLYIDKGAQYFRVDAVPFLWKELGTNCSHLPKTHIVVQLLRAIVEEIQTDLYIVTESNVPHEENISYWGSGEDEAHVIYNFSLAPLILHALTFETQYYIRMWAKNVFKSEEKTTYLNFTATHDGIGMRGLEGLIPEDDVYKLCEITERKNGIVGKKRSRDGSIKPYELNITWASFLHDDELSEEFYINKIVNSHAVIMFFPGISAHYVHNFFGTESWIEGREESGVPRRVNRKKCPYPVKYDEMALKIKERLIELIEKKSSCELFSPEVEIEVLALEDDVLSIRRFNKAKEAFVHFNLTSKEVDLEGIHLEPYELKIIL